MALNADFEGIIMALAPQKTGITLAQKDYFVGIKMALTPKCAGMVMALDTRGNRCIVRKRIYSFHQYINQEKSKK